jgi:hypothetical protein
MVISVKIIQTIIGMRIWWLRLGKGHRLTNWHRASPYLLQQVCNVSGQAAENSTCQQTIAWKTLPTTGAPKRHQDAITITTPTQR